MSIKMSIHISVHIHAYTTPIHTPIHTSIHTSIHLSIHRHDSVAQLVDDVWWVVPNQDAMPDHWQVRHEYWAGETSTQTITLPQTELKL